MGVLKTLGGAAVAAGGYVLNEVNELVEDVTGHRLWGSNTGKFDPKEPQSPTNGVKEKVMGTAKLAGIFGVGSLLLEKVFEFLSFLFEKLLSFFDFGKKDKEKEMAIETYRNNLNFYEKDLEFNRGRYKLMDEKQRTFNENALENMPEYGKKDPSKEYMGYTHYATALEKYGKVDPNIEPALRQNFMKMFKLSLDQIKSFDGDVRKGLPFAEWMTSKAYQDSFRDIVEQNNLYVNLSSKDKDLLEEAMLMTKEERVKHFKDKPELEEKFKLIQQTSLAIAGADRMAILQATENGVKSLYVGDLRSSNTGQLGTLQLTITTAFEKVGQMYDKETLRVEGEKILSKLNLERPFKEEEVAKLISQVGGNEVFYRQGLEPTRTLTKMLEEAKSRDEAAILVGKLQMVYGDEMRYIDVAQRILNDKTINAINKIGGLDKFDEVFQGENPSEKAKHLLKMMNINMGDHPITAQDILYRIGGKGIEDRKIRNENEALEVLGEKIEEDPRLIFSMGAYSLYHGTKDPQALKTGAYSLNVYGDDLKEANMRREDHQGTYLAIATEDTDLNKLKVEGNKVQLAEFTKSNSSINTILATNFKDRNIIKDGVRGDELLSAIEKSSEKSPVLNDFKQLLKDNAEHSFKYSPMEYVRLLSSQGDKKMPIAEMEKMLEQRRENWAKTELALVKIDEAGGYKEIEKTLAKNDEARLNFYAYAEKKPELKEYLEMLKNDPRAKLVAGTTLADLEKESVGIKDKLAGGKTLSEIRSEALVDSEIEKDKFELTNENRGGSQLANVLMMREVNQQIGETRLEGMRTEAKDFITEWEHRDKDYLKNSQNLAQLMLMLSYGKERLESYGLDYSEMIKAYCDEVEYRKLFSENKNDNLALAGKLIDGIKAQRDAVFGTKDDKTIEEMVEDVIEDIYVKDNPHPQFMSANTASFLIQGGLLTKDNFSNGVFDIGEVFDDMRGIQVKMRNGAFISFLRYGEDPNKYSKDDQDYYLAVSDVRRQNEFIAEKEPKNIGNDLRELTGEKLSTKTSNSIGIDLEALKQARADVNIKPTKSAGIDFGMFGD